MGVDSKKLNYGPRRIYAGVPSFFGLGFEMVIFRLSGFYLTGMPMSRLLGLCMSCMYIGICLYLHIVHVYVSYLDIYLCIYIYVCFFMYTP